MNTPNYQEQPRDLRALAGDLSALVVADTLGMDGGAARHLPGDMAGKLTVHLAMEDKGLAPTLLNGGRQGAADLARKHREEMGGIKQAFRAYLGAWPSGTAIQKDVPGFIAPTKGILAAVGPRIEAEEKHLHPAAERA
ncbi:MAG TPA: hemerythrin domain-containing protein [Holophagaceae bacterium]|nr:hemerythrin domain-containing protein [Holophagaceae bacterium]